jgi:small membrane protein
VLIKILAAGFAVYALRRLIARYRKGGTLTLEFIIWIAVWGGVGVVVFIPQKTDVVARWLGVGSGFNALTFITIVGLLYAVYRLYSRVQTVERDLTRLVRAAALERATHVAARQPTEPGWTIVPEDEDAA